MALRSAKSFLRDLARDTRGVILPYVTMMMTVIVGVSVLALDGARYESLQTQLQKGADSLALAGAAELNRLPDSITRATAAINATGSVTLVSNSSFFGTGSSANVTVSSICFLSSLPAGTTTNLGSCLSNTTDNAVSARFVQVVVSPVTINTILPASFFGGSNSVTTQAQAVAGNDTTLCNVTPLFMCNPFEPVGNTDYGAATQDLINRVSAAGADRTLRQLVGNNGGGSYAPGNFGYLQPSTGSLPNGTCGADKGNNNSVVQAMALSTVNACYNQNAVTTQTGSDSNVYEALDVRFDLWKGITGSFNNCSTNSAYAPDTNVRKGYLPGNGNNGACNASAAGRWPPGTTGINTNTNAAVGFPLDDNMLTNGAMNAVTVGNGNWTCGDITNLSTGSGAPVVSGNGNNATTTFNVAGGTTTGIFAGMTITSTGALNGAVVSAVSSSSSVTVQGNFPTIVSNVPLTFPGYWNTAHPAGTSGNGHAPSGCSNNAAATISRYSVYQAEINGSYTADKSGGKEQGSGKMCSTTTPVAGRRLLHIAVVNCQAELGNLNGHRTVPVAAYVKVFLTLPVDKTVAGPYVEISGLDTPGDGFQYQSVQLYR